MSGCILWDGPIHNAGYGQQYMPGSGYGAKDQRTELAHRLAWEAEHGPIPDDLHVHHRCGNKLCVNVDHLELLSAQQHRGAEGHGKLTQADANNVRWMLSHAVRAKDVAEFFGCSPQLVCHIRKGRCWV